MDIELNLENLKVGDEIVTIRPNAIKNTIKYGPVRIIIAWDEKYKRWLYSIPNKLEKTVGSFPINGYGFDFMSRSKTPNFYYSANPKHIEASKAYYDKLRLERLAREEEYNRRFSLARPIGSLLHTEYYDSEECYNLDTTNDITEILVARLTDEQIIELKGWLGLD